jgi:hypothetical protein
VSQGLTPRITAAVGRFGEVAEWCGATRATDLTEEGQAAMHLAPGPGRQRPSGVMCLRYAARLRGFEARSQTDPGLLLK